MLYATLLLLRYLLQDLESVFCSTAIVYIDCLNLLLHLSTDCYCLWSVTDSYALQLAYWMLLSHFKLHFKFGVCWPRLDCSMLLMCLYDGAVACHCTVPLVIVTDVACSCGHIGDDVWGKQSRWYVRPGGLTWPSIAISTEFHLSFSFQSCHSLKPSKFIVLVKRVKLVPFARLIHHSSLGKHHHNSVFDCHSYRIWHCWI